MNDFNGSLDLLPSAEETLPGEPFKAFERRRSLGSDDPDSLAAVKLYGVWTTKLAKDEVSADVAWKRLRKLAYDGLEAFCDRLAAIEQVTSNEFVSYLDYEAMLEKQRELEVVSESLQDFEIEFRHVSKAFQNISQFLPPCPQRASVKARMSASRKRYYVTLDLFARKKQTIQMMLPLLEQYKGLGSEMKSWLDATEARSELFIKSYNDHNVILQNEEAIETIREELFVQKEVYETFLEAGEKMLDLNKLTPLNELKDDIDDIISRWDALVSSIEKCVNRLAIAKKLAEENKKVDTEKIEMKIRSEAQLCTCHKPFQIIKVGLGKYTFGTSKIVRLVRIHGSSIVVRVGGGWQFLYDFLLKADPCRAKQIKESAQNGIPTMHLAGLNLAELDKKNGSEEFSLNVQRMTQKNWSPYRSRYDRSGSVGSAASSDNMDGLDESTDSMSLSTSGSTNTPISKTNTQQTRSQTPLRKQSGINSRSSSVEQLSRVKKNTPRRISLIERQAEYAAKRKSMSFDHI